MADGGTKPIADITVGDEVLAGSPYTEGNSPHRVSKLITGTGTGTKHLVDIQITGPGGTSTITATSNHPVWAQDHQSWVDAGQLTPGEHLRTADGHDAVIQTVRPYDDQRTVYNLTVENLHTYYVHTGDSGVLSTTTAAGPNQAAPAPGARSTKA